MIQGDFLMPNITLYLNRESARIFPKPSTIATAQALRTAVCHFSRAKTLSTSTTKANTSNETSKPSTGTGGEEQIHPAQQKHTFVPMRDFDQRQRPAGELRGDAAHQLLVSVVGAGQVEGRLAEFDFERVEEAQEDSRQRQDQQSGVVGDLFT